MRNDQKKFLKERLAEAYRLYRSRLPKRWDSTIPEPADVRAARAAVKKAEAVIHRWDQKLQKRYDDSIERLRLDYQKAQEALLFHDPAKALAAVEAFEKRVPQK